MKELKMLSGHIAVEEIKQTDNVSKGGIHMPGTAAQGPLLMGTVISKSDKYVAFGATIPTDLSVGDRVIYEAQRAKEVELDGVKIAILHASDIKLRIVEEVKTK